MHANLRLPLLAGTVVLLAGCASVNVDDAVRATNEAVPGFTAGKLELSRTDAQRQSRERLAAELLAKPLSMDESVQLALANSPALQALIAQSWADMAAANQYGRLANPIFTFERLRLGDELEIGRLLSFGLLDLITLPRRQAIAQNQVGQARTMLAITVVEQVSQVRQAWVRAVAARQSLSYAEQVSRNAEASAELARRMQAVGNFTRLQRARQQAFYADAATQLAAASHEATATREDLVRQLGLTSAQARELKLPERLPDLPKEPKSTQQIAGSALQQRLDVRLARQQLDVAGQAQGLNLLNTLVDVEVGARRDTVFDDATGQRQNRRGFELGVRLPLFDWGAAQRAALNAQSLLAANRYDAVVRGAESELRQTYSAYRTAYDVARHYRDEVVPLRQTIAEENMARYNGMLIGVFELLAEQRDQVAAVMAAINAQQQFWLADAGLAASVTGKPMAAGAPAAPSTPAGQAGGAGH